MTHLRSLLCFDILFLFLSIRLPLCITSREAKIVGGIAVPIDQFPYAVQVFNWGSLCGGTILSSLAVLTAAHCFDNNKNVRHIHVRFGARFMHDKTAVRSDIWYFIQHEDYNKEAPFDCDIALIFTRQPIQFTKRAQKAILVNTNQWMNEREHNFIAIGWGRTSSDGSSARDLMEVFLRFVPCKHVYKGRHRTKNMFCLYGDGERDTCQGDSGGAVLWNGLVVGLVSHGEGCAKNNTPGVYTNVYYFWSWMEKKIKKAHKMFCHRLSRTGIQ